MFSLEQKVPEGIVFFSGDHGVGKTYTATAMLDYFDARIIDCGPIIRNTFAESGFTSFGGWVKNMEQKLGQRWDDELLLTAIKNYIACERFLFVVGNRDIETILFLSEKLPHKRPPVIIYLEKPTPVIKSGYELRTKSVLTDEEFEAILHSGPDAKLGLVKEYVMENPDHCKLIYEDGYSGFSIDEAVSFVRTKYK